MFYLLTMCVYFVVLCDVGSGLPWLGGPTLSLVVNAHSSEASMIEYGVSAAARD